MAVVDSQLAPRRNWAALAVTGMLVGLASGLFGVGGGLIIVPALVLWLGYQQRLAAGTSLLAIVAPSLAGVASYATQGHVDPLLSGLLAGGSIVGAPIGAWLLAKLSKRALQWSFIAFLVVVIALLFVVIPDRDARVHVDLVNGALIVLVGVGAGVLAGLLGIGGGIVVVPALVLLFGASDVMAKGTSLLMIIATGIAGTVANVRRGNVDLRAAGVIGLAAALLTPAGVWIAHALDPFWANVAFAGFLVFVIIRMAIDAWPRRREP